MPLTRRILLVEDDPMDIDLTLAALEANHVPHEVVVPRDGAEAPYFVDYADAIKTVRRFWVSLNQPPPLTVGG